MEGPMTHVTWAATAVAAAGAAALARAALARVARNLDLHRIYFG